MTRVNAQRQLVTLCRLVEIALARQGDSQVALNVGAPRAQACCLAKAGRGLDEAPLAQQGVAEIIMSVGVVRIEEQRLLKMFDGGLELA